MERATTVQQPAVTTGNSAVYVRDLTVVKEGFRILDRVSFQVAEGSFFGIVGPNGGGKTTLLKVILGLQTPSGGKVLVLNQPPGRCRHVGYLPQKVTFDPRFPVTGLDVVRMALDRKTRSRLGGLGTDEALRWALDMSGMTRKAHLPLRQLSGGEQQRIFLARALVKRPKLLVLDEPTLGVDASALDGFMHGLERIREDRNITLLMVSHEHTVIRYHTDLVLCVSRTASLLGRSQDVTTELLAKTFGHHEHPVEHPVDGGG